VLVENLQMLGGRETHNEQHSKYAKEEHDHSQKNTNTQKHPSDMPQHPEHSAPQQQKQYKNTIPEIDISEDEIPF